MPIYEFRCAACGARFEEVLPAGGDVERCPDCGAEAPDRALSSPAPPLHLVRTPREMRKQERKNAKLRDTTKAGFKEARRKAREAKAAAKQVGDG